jgi:hypothetical protein
MLIKTNLITDRCTTSVSVHPRSDVHAHQLLEKKLRCIGDVNLRDLGLRLAVLAKELLRLELPGVC